MKPLRLGLLVAVVTGLLPRSGEGGSFVGAGDDWPDLRAHQNYHGGGGDLTPVRVCVDISVNPTLAIAAEPAVHNVIATYNRFRSLPDNTFAQFPDNSAPADKPDFETVLLHEFMHANGLGHPQHAGDPAGDPGGPYPFQATRSAAGPNGVLDHVADPDGIPGSADDQRGDDDNLNWYVRGVNHPGVLPAVVDTTTMARELDGLPAGHAFAANGNAAAMAALGRANSESATHQGHVAGQVQRHLHHEDMAMLRLARAGLDGLAGTDDDYRSVATYAGRYHDPQGGECNIVVRFDDNGGTVSFASTMVGLTPLATDHFRLIYPTRMRFNPAVDWYFTPGANTVVQIVADTPDPSAGLAPYDVQASVAKAAYNTMGGDPRGKVIVRDGPRDDPRTATCEIELTALSGGIGTCQLTPLAAGHKTLTADYLGWGGWDGGTATATHVVTGTLEFSAITHAPHPSAPGADVEFAWTLAPPAGFPAVQASGEVVVKEAADCASPPLDPAHQCSATLPANACTIAFASSGVHSMQLCYAGAGAIAPASGTVTHEVLAERPTTTTLLAHTPAQTAPFESYTVQVQVRETPDQGGHPQGAVIVSDGAVGDPLTSSCTATLAGTPGETASCVLASKQAGSRTLSAQFAQQGLWAASSAQTAHPVRGFAIASHLPGTSRQGEAVSVVVTLDVRPFGAALVPTGNIVVGDGVDQCTIVLPASECLWRGSTAGTRQLTASWAGDANYAGGTTAPVAQIVEAGSPPYPQWISEPRYGHAESNGPSTSSARALSADGRYVVFSSLATDLVSGDGNGVEDVFVRDQLSGAVRRVSTASNGAQGSGASRFPAISADGRYVSFQSEASNFFPGDGADKDVFVKDLHSGAIVRATTLANGSAPVTAELASHLMHSALSADGRYVAFSSYRVLAPGDINGRVDVYVKDLASGAVDLVSSNALDQPGDGHSHLPAISADGRHVAYASTAGNLVPDFTPNSLANKIFVKDRLTRTSRLASATAAGVTASGLCNDHPAISADGRYVAFQCTSSNLPMAGGWNGERVFVKDMTTGAVDLASGSGSNSLAPAISADGRYVAFQQGLGGYVGVLVRDRQTGALVNHHVTPTGEAAREETVSWEPRLRPAISADGRFVAFQSVSPRLVARDLNAAADVFVRNRDTGITQRASAAHAGVRNDGDSGTAIVSRDGGDVLYASSSTQLIVGDANGAGDVFLHERDTGATTRLSTSAAGTPGNGASFAPAFAEGAREAVFLSAANNLVPNDTNGKVDAFVKSLDDGAIQRVSVVFGLQSPVDVLAPVSISRDGRIVAFTSPDGSQYSGCCSDNNGFTDIVLIKRENLSPALISRNPVTNTKGNGHSLQATISDDAAFVAFASDATNFELDNGSAARDVFVYSGAVGKITQLASSDAAGVPGNGHSEHPVLSADGRYVAFVSAATNLVAGDDNGVRDIFAKDLETGAIERINTTAAGAQGVGGDCGSPSFSSGARYVGFLCIQGNLVPGAANGLVHYYVKDRATGAIVRLSENATGVPANADSRASLHALADDGAALFESNASTLAAPDSIGVSNVFLGAYSATPLAATTTTIVSVSPSVPSPGSPYTVTVEVAGAGAVPPGGQVRMFDSGFAVPCTGILTPGTPSTASCALTTNSSGAWMLTAYYGGDFANAASASPEYALDIPDPQPPGKPTIGTVTPGNGRATVTFFTGNIGSPFLDHTATCGGVSVVGTASPIVVSPLTNGATVDCTVTTRNHFGTSPASDPVAVTPKAGTATAIVAHVPEPSLANTPYTVSVTVLGEGTPAPGGQVTVSDGAASCNAALTPGAPSTGSCALTSATRGNKTLSASYAGDAANTGSSASVSHAVGDMPGAPTLQSATPGNARVTLGFDAPTDNGGSAILDYTATCGTQTATGTVSPIAVTGLANGVEASCHVTVRTALGTSVASNALTATPRTVPGAPLLTGVQGGDTNATVTFDAPADNGGSTITGYTALCGTKSALGTASPLVVTGLVNGVQVGCRVLARNVAGVGAFSNTANVTPATTPGAPTVTAVQAGDASATVIFDAPAGNGGSAILDYTATCGTQSATGAASPLVVTGLTNSVEVSCQATARNAIGTSAASNALTVTPLGVPGTPLVTAVQAGDASATVSFDAPADNGGTAILDYTATCGTQTSTGTASPLTVTGLVNGIEVNCHVTARNAVGTSAASNVIAVSPARMPSAPVLTGASPGDGSATLQFDAPDDGGRPITAYIATCGSVSVQGSASPIVVDGLANAVVVECRVVARNAMGDSAPSNALSVTPQAAIVAPGAPVLIAAQPGDGRVTLQFDASADDGGSAILDYTATCGSISVVGAASPIVVTPLANGIAVSCRVAARNAVGTSTPSNALSATPATVPGAPVLTAVTALASGARIAFAAPADDGGSAVVDYEASCTPGTAGAIGATSPIDVAGLTPLQAYRCRVRARNAMGSGAFSSEGSVIPGQGGASADLSIAKSNGTDYVNDADFIVYLITVHNAGPAAVVGARVEDALAPDFAQATWTCDADASAWCPADGNGALDVRVDLPANTSVRFHFAALPAAAGLATPVINTASVTPPDGIDDPQLGNNVAVDGPDARGVFRDGFEGVDAASTSTSTSASADAQGGSD